MHPTAMRCASKRIPTTLVALFTTAVLFAAVASPASALPQNFFGFQYGSGWGGNEQYPDSEPDLEAVARSGARYWRLGFDCYSWYNDKSGVWNTWDKRVELAWEHGITVLPNLSGRCGTVAVGLPWQAEWGLWEEFLETMIQRYGYGGSFWSGKENKREIENWELQNEPNLGSGGIDGVASGRVYAEFFQRMSEALHSAQGSFFPTHAIVGGLYYVHSDGTSRTPHTFIDEMSSKVSSVIPWVDGVAIHPYEWGSSAVVDSQADINEARSDVDSMLGVSKPIWITEIGWNVEHGDTSRPNISAAEQSSRLSELFNWVKAVQASKKIESLIYYNYRDFAFEETWISGCGLRTRPPVEQFSQSTFRPAWYAYQEETGASKWPVAPSVETQAATDISSTSATLNGAVNPHGLPAGYHFEWAEGSEGVAHQVPAQAADAGWREGSASESVAITDLNPGTVYHFRIVSTNENVETSVAPELTFTTPPTSAMEISSDFNGDGKADLLGRESNGTVKVQLSTGNGFAEPTSWGGFSDALMPMYAADFNGDGKADLLGRESSGTVKVYLSAGNGFAEPTSWGGFADALMPMYAGDFNGDGKDDLLGRESSGTVKVYLSVGSGFQEAVSWGGFADVLMPMYAADFNGDGKADLLGRESSGTVKVYLSTGNGFAEPTSWGGFADALMPMYAADVNGDGMTDLLGRESNSAVTVYLSSGAGFREAAVWGGFSAALQPMSLADVNGDGKDDLLGRESNGTVKVYLSNSSAFQNPISWGGFAEALMPMYAGDFNGDGKYDLLGRESNGTVKVYLSAGSGFAEATSWGGFATSLMPIRVADVNGDGKDDLLGRESNGTVKVYLSAGSGFAEPTSWGGFADALMPMYAGDFNGDGKDDLLGRESNGTVKVYLSADSGFAEATSWGGFGTSLMPIRVADVNGDGKDDLLGRESNGTVKVYLSAGSGFAEPTSWGGFADALMPMYASDVNGDGMADLVGRESSGTVKVQLSAGLGFGNPATWGNLSGTLLPISLADLNGDGKADLFGRESNGTVMVYLSNSSAFQDPASWGGFADVLLPMYIAGPNG